MATIQALRAVEIRDSRGTPTVEVGIITEGEKGTASVPSGASVGAHEALELRDEDGRGVRKAIDNVNDIIAPGIIGRSFDQASLDAYLCELDGTPNKSRLGANAVLGISLAFARAAASEAGVPLYAYIGALDGRTSFMLPQPLFNILNGGKHTEHGIDIQESMLAPTGIGTIRGKVDAATACMATLRSELEEKGYATAMGDEGGFAPNLSSNDEALDMLVVAIGSAGYSDEIQIALDVASSSFFRNSAYVLHTDGKEKRMGEAELLAWYEHLASSYPLISIEDGFAEDDWEGFAALTRTLGSSLSIVGDDLTVTNVSRIQEAVEKKAVNACIIKPNQIGTLSEAVAAVRAARVAGWKTFASHRSGETLDTFIADFAVGLSCDYLKAGAPTREERKAKYTRLMEIEAELTPA